MDEKVEITITSRAAIANQLPILDPNTSQKTDSSEQNESLEDEGNDRQTSKVEAIVLMTALSLANFLVALDTTIVTTALPSISDYFHSSVGYAWIGSAYMLANASTAPIWAKFSDIWGRKPLLLLAISVFSLGSLLCAVSTSMIMLILARTVQGIGSGGVGILVSVCIADVFSMRERPLYFGIIGMTWALASAIGPLLGGLLTSKASWKWCFYINLPCTALSFAAVLWKLKVHTPKTPLIAGLKAVDWTGSITIITSSVLLLLGLQMGGVEHPWSSAIILSFLIVGVAVGVIFLLVEWKFSKYPLMPLRVFKDKGNVAVIIVGCCHSMATSGGTYFLPLYFQGVLGASPLMSGVYLLPLALSLSVMSSGIGFVVRGTGRYLAAMRIATLLMSVGFGLFIDLGPGYVWSKLILYQIIAGLGIGPNFQCPLIALQANTSQGDTASTTSTYNFLRNLAASVAIVVGTVIFQNQMEVQQAKLVESVGAEVASLLTGSSTAANLNLIEALPHTPRRIAHAAIAKSLSMMWVFFAVASFVSFIATWFAPSIGLREEHRLTETGLEAEEKKRLEKLRG